MRKSYEFEQTRATWLDFICFHVERDWSYNLDGYDECFIFFLSRLDIKGKIHPSWLSCQSLSWTSSLTCWSTVHFVTHNAIQLPAVRFSSHIISYLKRAMQRCLSPLLCPASSPPHPDIRTHRSNRSASKTSNANTFDNATALIIS